MKMSDAIDTWESFDQLIISAIVKMNNNTNYTRKDLCDEDFIRCNIEKELIGNNDTMSFDTVEELMEDLYN